MKLIRNSSLNGLIHGMLFGPVAAFAQDACSIPGIVAWWPGDRDATDFFGRNNGVLIDGASSEDGSLSEAFSFDGNQSYMEATVKGLPLGASDRTLECWVRVLNFTGTEEAMFCGYGAFGTDGGVFSLGSLSDRRIFVSQWGDALVGPKLKLNTWYHMAATASNSVVSLYLNGNLVGMRQMHLDTAFQGKFLAGRIPGFLGNSRRLSGNLDEIAIFSRALGQEEIAKLYEAGRQGRCSSLEVTSSVEFKTFALGQTNYLEAPILGGFPLTYQWFKDGIAIPGEAGRQIYFESTRMSDSGLYSITCSNAWGQMETSVARIVVLPILIQEDPISTIVVESSSTVLSVTACCAPLEYQWFRNGRVIPDATDTHLQLNQVRFEDAGAYSVRVTSPVSRLESRAAHVMVVPSKSVGESVDAKQFDWISEGDSVWFSQIQDFHLGTESVRSGPLGDLGHSILKTRVRGPGTLVFWWKVSSEKDYDFLSFSGGDLMSPLEISGEVEWKRETVKVPTGDQDYTWEYRKDSTDTIGQDCGWLDEVQLVTPGQIYHIELSDDQVEVVFGTIQDVKLRVEASNVLGGPWYPVGQEVTGDGLLKRVVDTEHQMSSRYYRVR